MASTALAGAASDNDMTHFVVSVMLAAWFLGPAGAMAQPQIPTRSCFGMATMREPVLSPDGRHLALVVAGRRARATRPVDSRRQLGLGAGGAVPGLPRVSGDRA